MQQAPSLERPPVAGSTLAMLLSDLHERPHSPESDTDEACEEIAVAAILDRARQAGFGFIVAILALISIPLVGLTIPLGLTVAAAGLQMIAGRPHPWVPRFIGRRRVSVAAIQALGRRTERWTTKLGRVVRPRLTWMTSGPLLRVCGGALVVQGLSLSLPVPGADWLFVVPIVLYGIGLLERDGVLILFCHLLTLTQIVLAFVLWHWIANGFIELYHYISPGVG